MSVSSKIHRLWGSSFFWKWSKLNLGFENDEKNSLKFFCFRDNCIWNNCNKFWLLRRKYLSSAVNVLTKNPKTLHIAKKRIVIISSQWVTKQSLHFAYHSLEHFKPTIAFTGINKYGKGAVTMFWTVFWPVYYVTCWRILWKGPF